MKRVLFALVLLVLVSCAISSVGYSATIADCATVTSDTQLTADITDSSETKCIIINTANVVFDCQGHMIGGNGTSASYGIDIGANNVTVNNCILSDWGYGIDTAGNFMVSRSDIKIYNVDIANSTNGITNSFERRILPVVYLTTSISLLNIESP